MTTDDERKTENANSFGAAADEYDRARPSYPIQSVDWLLPVTARHVLDLGAGTGKLTALLVERGFDVVAIDPSAEMLAKLDAAITDATSAVGTAEDIPLPDDSVDAVVVAQAWHWVDPERAVPEVARVLRPGGTLGLIWNVRDERVGWVARLTEIIHSSNAEEFLRTDELRAEGVVPQLPPLPGGLFGTPETHEVDWEEPVDRAKIIDLVSSRSHFLTSSDEQKAATLAEVAALLDSHPQLAGLTDWVMPYRTFGFRLRLL
ncbi:class I SAM-dependent methyltransferase [Glaciihabitans sp. dw_435]|uniref:class I SAM-dependent methyltransferase n=1 Tax=Glaciihabitans sp. dw_435 TaxID=2720081 RepID=UPI001BD54E0A|nr:class I SAM-dependent methyltransferase [Glaciihabitans sp. dw_435]